MNVLLPDTLTVIFAYQSLNGKINNQLVCKAWYNTSKVTLKPIYDLKAVSLSNKVSFFRALASCKNMLRAEYPKKFDLHRQLSKCLENQFFRVEEGCVRRAVVDCHSKWILANILITSQNTARRWCQLMSRPYGSMMFRGVDFFLHPKVCFQQFYE